MSQAVDLRHLDYARRGEFYIAANDWNLAWTAEELETVRLMRAEGAKIWTCLLYTSQAARGVG